MNIKKIGHTGTLDPNATGLLTVAIGEASKFIKYLPEDKKVYQADIYFGEERDTDDITGKPTKKTEKNFTREELQEVLNSFLGRSLQTPPDFSAKKIKGKKLYDYAREGNPVEHNIQTEIEIDTIEVLEDSDFNNHITIEVKCSKGTYIRSLARDIGRKLGSSAYMGDLRRIESGPFSLDNAVSLDEENKKDHITSIEANLAIYPKIKVEKTAKKKLINGNVLNSGDFTVESDQNHTGLLFLEDQFYGIGEYKNDKVFPLRMLKLN